MDFLEPIVEIIAGAADVVADSSNSPKGCLINFIIMGVIIGIVALIIYLL